MSLADVALRFGPAEYAALLTLLLAAVSAAAIQPLQRSAGMAVMGLLLGTLGEDDWGHVRNLPGLSLEPETLAVLVTCVAIFALVVPQIARHALAAAAQAPQPARAQGRAAAWWNTLYQCLGFWPASGALLVTSGAWARPSAWAGSLATAWCGLMLAWYGLPPELFGMCALVALAGLVCMQLDCPVVPLMAGMLASPVLEQNFQRSLLLTQGDWLPVLQRPLTAGMLSLALLLLAGRAWLQWRNGLARALP